MQGGKTDRHASECALADGSEIQHWKHKVCMCGTESVLLVQTRHVEEGVQYLDTCGSWQ